MRKRSRAGWMLTGICALSLGVASAQEEGPILLPKPKPKPATSATLMVICDLACNWKLDGVAKGRIEAGSSAKIKVELGQHLVVAVTEDGADQVKQFIDAKANAQAAVSIVLQPVRDARLKSEQEAREKAQQEARDKAQREAQEKAAREQQEKEQKESEEAALRKQKKELEEREQTARDEAAGLIWVDPATGLMWPKRPNGKSVNWEEATAYCRSLELAGHSDWRMPTIDELKGIFDPETKLSDGIGYVNRIKGNIVCSRGCFVWSSSSGQKAGRVRVMEFIGQGPVSDYSENSKMMMRALCVRSSGDGTYKRAR